MIRVGCSGWVAGCGALLPRELELPRAAGKVKLRHTVEFRDERAYNDTGGHAPRDAVRIREMLR